MTEFYIRLTHKQYKDVEEQLSSFKLLETIHTSVEGFYHKAFRLRVGDVIFELMGPTVPKPSPPEEEGEIEPVLETILRFPQVAYFATFTGLRRGNDVNLL